LKDEKKFMLTKDLARTLEALKLMAEAKEAVGEFYRACANVPGEDPSFWLQAAGEEDTHKKSVQKMEEMISRNPENFSLRRPFNPFEDPDPGEARTFLLLPAPFGNPLRTPDGFYPPPVRSSPLNF
jgi:hypothetical protein